MRIGLYLEHGAGDGVGGAELKMALLASVWSRDHEVDLVHHRPPLTRERLALFSSDDYSRVNIRYVPREQPPSLPWDPVRRYTAARRWQAAISEPYDVFVNCTHWVPCFSHARLGILHVLFPFYEPEWRPQLQDPALPRWRRIRQRLYYGFEWQRRLASYDHITANSEYTARWTERRWGVPCRVVYSPVNVDFTPRPKDPLIVSVGRFSTTAHSKKQLETVRTFARLSGTRLRGWEYACVGGLNSKEENHRYFEQVRAAGRGVPATIEANVPRPRVRSLLERARIFWHAAGYGEDPERQPQLAEHFGVATVEAMAAGCVPVVINRGGQPEIVTHGENGFLWNTLDELADYTERLARDLALVERMSQAARRRAREFDRRKFVERMSALAGIDVTDWLRSPSADAEHVREAALAFREG
ncbi:MAG TPA: glycosyltransferase family 4 protein [Vicinamibacterales bacterium]|nr:glycosyltransferase family 4 protein [Vicinamibacterales bacterium]